MESREQGREIRRETGEVSGSTVAAISTAQAPGGIGIVRISGPKALEVADRVFTAKSGKLLKDQKGYTMLYGRVHTPIEEGPGPEE